MYILYKTNLTYLKSVKSQTGSLWKEGKREREREREKERKKERERERKKDNKFPTLRVTLFTLFTFFTQKGKSK